MRNKEATPMKRTVIFLLCLLLILCGGNHASHASEEVPILGKGDYFPLEQPVQLTAWVVNAVDNISIKNSYVLDWIREETNVDLQITKEFSGSGAKDKLSLSVATAQELPDILLCTRWTKAECALYGMQGLVLPLDAYLEDCENWNKLTEICGPEHVSDLMMPDGHIYCYGAVNECFHLTHQARMWLYKDWVDLLLDGCLPETTEEFYDYLCKVATMDPNGNGIADEIPLTGQIDEGWANDPFTFLSNAFVHNNTIYGSTNQTVASGCYLEDGEVRCNWVEEEYREALRYMNRLYSEGLLHSQVFSQNQQQMTAQVEATPNVVGAVACGYIPSVRDEPRADGTWTDWVCLPPLMGPDGTRMSYQSNYDYFYNCNGLITRDCRDPETAVQLFDFLASSEGNLVQNYGIENVNWAWSDEGVGLDGGPSIYKFFWDSAEEGASVNWPADVHIGSMFDAFRLGLQVEEGTYNGEKILWECAESYDHFSPGKETVYPNIAYTAEQSQELIRYQAPIEEYVRRSLIQFVSGSMNLDANWYAYLDMLDILGQENYHALLQEAYDDYCQMNP